VHVFWLWMRSASAGVGERGTPGAPIYRRHCKEYIYERSIYTSDSGSMVSDVRRVRGRLHQSASPEDWAQASAL